MWQNEQIRGFLVVSVTIKEKCIGPSMKTTYNNQPAFDCGVSSLFDDNIKRQTWCEFHFSSIESTAGKTRDYCDNTKPVSVYWLVGQSVLVCCVSALW